MKAAQAREVLNLLVENFTVSMLVPELEVAKIKSAISLAKARSPSITGRLTFHEEDSHKDGLRSLTIVLTLASPTFAITAIGVQSDDD